MLSKKEDEAMRFWNSTFTSVLTAVALLGHVWASVEACEAVKPPSALQAASIQWQRPVCQKSQTHLGLCFAADMPLAVQITSSAAFQQTRAQVAQQAQAYLDTIEPAPNKVIVTDLDDTVIATEAYYATHPVLDPPTWERWSDETAGRAELIQPVWDLLKAAKAKGFKVMFITGRPEHMTISTLNQMPTLDWDGIYLKPQGLSITSTVYKTQVRQMLRNLGYQIVLTLGDQPSDFDLPVRPTEGEFLLPNLMYAIP